MSNTSVQTCKRCLYNTNHPLGLVLDSEGICSGCRVHEEKDTLDWAERWQRLEQLVKPYRSRDTRNYDCIVPVSGAGDSFFIVHLVKERLGLQPRLLPTTATTTRLLANATWPNCGDVSIATS